MKQGKGLTNNYINMKSEEIANNAGDYRRLRVFMNVRKKMRTRPDIPGSSGQKSAWGTGCGCQPSARDGGGWLKAGLGLDQGWIRTE